MNAQKTARSTALNASNAFHASNDVLCNLRSLVINRINGIPVDALMQTMQPIDSRTCDFSRVRVVGLPKPRARNFCGINRTRETATRHHSGGNDTP